MKPRELPLSAQHIPPVPPVILGELPAFPPLSRPTFTWGTRDAACFITDVNRAYEATTKWRKNVFKLPSGAVGKKFTQALTKLYIAWGERGPMEGIALKAAAIMVPLLLQQPNGKSTYRENSVHLQRRLDLWEAGSLSELIDECGTIQQQLKSSHKVMDDSTLAKRFATMIFNNNFKGAMSLVCDKGKGGILSLDESTKKDMQSKHPAPEPISVDALQTGDMPASPHPIFFSAIDSDLIKRCALRTKGGAGVSQQEDVLWQKMTTAFNATSTGLRCCCLSAQTCI
ncbi:MAG: hypothetical protein ABI002_13220 [Saprospiraceae bacterium]